MLNWNMPNWWPPEFSFLRLIAYNIVPFLCLATISNDDLKASNKERCSWEGYSSTIVSVGTSHFTFVLTRAGATILYHFYKKVDNERSAQAVRSMVFAVQAMYPLVIVYARDVKSFQGHHDLLNHIYCKHG